MGWVCQICKTDHGGSKSDDPPLCYTKPDCKKKGAYACKWEEAAAPEWSFTASSKLSKPSKAADAKADLKSLITAASGNVHSRSIGTVVGGDKAKKGKKVSGLKDGSARIDIQNPVKGAYNVQYQIGEKSYACVLFTDDDDKADVLKNLKKSLKEGKIAVSPNVGKK